MRRRPARQRPRFQPWDGMPGWTELVAHYTESTGRDVSAFRWNQGSWPASA
ncbi:hypothetical protein [Streptomyces sp. NPDC012616]|uniref:hypothetical protein n=1 Tax=Streptomyces sp. NPDC012616 TaxID=3364840 RepID=UPI0036E3BA60